MISDVLKRELIRAGQQCVRIATEGKRMGHCTVYKTASKEYVAAAKARDEVLANIRLADPTIRDPSSKSRSSEWVRHALPYKEAALQMEIDHFNLRTDIGTVGHELAKSSLNKRKKEMENERRLAVGV